jgi:hypothetical protein
MKVIHRKMDRRRFLRGAGALGAASLALPVLPSLLQAQDLFPKRLVVFFSGNGTIAPEWSPTSENGRLTSMSNILEPLAEHMNDITVLEGLDIKVARNEWQGASGFHAHERGLGGILTGQNLSTGDMEAGSGYATGISVDQFIANSLQGQTNLHSLQVGMITRRHGSGWYNRDTMTYAGDGQPLFAESDGTKLFDRIFGETTGTAVTVERARDRRASVLDFLREDMSRVEKELSAEDRERVAEHHTAFRELEDRLSQPLPTCEAPGGGFNEWFDQDNMSAISDFQIEQTVRALACDLARVATFQYGKGLGGLSLRPIGLSDSWHSLSHEGDSNADAQAKLTQLNRYIAGRFAKLLTEMKSVPEGDGTMLDNSVVLWLNELGKGNNHDHDDVPIVMAGSLGGVFKEGGRHVQFGERPHNDLLITLCHAFGQQVQTFGRPELCSGPLSELLV